MTTKYEYENETFTVSKPEDCMMEVSGKGLTAKISIHTATNMYRESLDGWGSDHKTLNAAVDSACQRILIKSARPPTKDLCVGMDEFYGSLGK